MLFLTTSKRYYAVGVHTTHKRMALILCPLTKGFELFYFFVTKKIPQVNTSQGSTHGEANDKCIRQNKMITGTMEDNSLLQTPNCKTVHIYRDLYCYFCKFRKNESPKAVSCYHRKKRNNYKKIFFLKMYVTMPRSLSPA